MEPDRAQTDDPVGVAQAQWRAILPDVDSTALRVTGRLLALGRLVEAQREEMLRPHGLGVGDFDVLATLRRAGDGLRPGALQHATLSSSAGMTGRLDRLERAGLVERLEHPDDRRGVRVVLTDTGRRLVDQLFTELMARERGWLDRLAASDRRSLERMLARALTTLGPS